MYYSKYSLFFNHFNQIRCTADIFATVNSSTLTQFIFWFWSIFPFTPSLFPRCSSAFFIHCLISKLAVFLLLPRALFSHTSVCLCLMKLSLGLRDSYLIPECSFSTDDNPLWVCGCVYVCVLWTDEPDDSYLTALKKDTQNKSKTLQAAKGHVRVKCVKS